MNVEKHQPVKVAVIGCGKIAQSEHLPAWRLAEQQGLCHIVAVCDRDATTAENTGRQYAVEHFTEAEVMLDRIRPDVVDISTAVVTHHQLVLLALEAGCHVLCEKPVGMNKSEVVEILETAKRLNRVFSVCFQYRTWEEARYLQKRIAAGELGNVHFVRTWGGDVHSFALHRPDYPGRGVLAHWIIHNLDLALWMLGNPEPVSASAVCHQRLREYPSALGPAERQLGVAAVRSDIEDFACGLVRLHDGAAIAFETNWLQQPSERFEGFELLGAKGSASVNPIRVMLDREHAWVDDSPVPGRFRPCSYQMDYLMSEFIEATHTGVAPVSEAEVLRIQTLVDALYLSADLGREVTIDTGIQGPVGGQADPSPVTHDR